MEGQRVGQNQRFYEAQNSLMECKGVERDREAYQSQKSASWLESECGMFTKDKNGTHLPYHNIEFVELLSCRVVIFSVEGGFWRYFGNVG